MAKMFDETENHDFERLNDWYMGCLESNYRSENVDIWVKRFEHFLCQKNETLNQLGDRFESLIEYLWKKDIKVQKDEHIAKLTDALRAKWDEFLIELKKNPIFPELHPR
ncbi:hypothetical protein Hanom_Chr07g00665861 [Helianthus anomalus]